MKEQKEKNQVHDDKNDVTERKRAKMEGEEAKYIFFFFSRQLDHTLRADTQTRDTNCLEFFSRELFPRFTRVELVSLFLCVSVRFSHSLTLLTNPHAIPCVEHASHNSPNLTVSKERKRERERERERERPQEKALFLLPQSLLMLHPSSLNSSHCLFSHKREAKWRKREKNKRMTDHIRGKFASEI